MLTEVGPRGKVLAGGQSVVPLLNMHLAAPAHLVDVNWLGELDEVATDAAAVRVGAVARQARVEHDADAAEADFFVGPLESTLRPGELATAKRSSPRCSRSTSPVGRRRHTPSIPPTRSSPPPTNCLMSGSRREE